MNLQRYHNHFINFVKKTRLDSAYSFIYEQLFFFTFEECYAAINHNRSNLKSTAKLKMKMREQLYMQWLDSNLENDHKGYEDYKKGKKELELRSQKLSERSFGN